MNSRNTWRWLIVAAVLFAFILFQQRYLRKTGGGPSKVLPSLKVAGVTSVQVRPAAQLESFDDVLSDQDLKHDGRMAFAHHN